ncbi:MAG: 6,7-dimethyl-8-ribityllumazine synthase [Rhodospirillales bacterium]
MQTPRVLILEARFYEDLAEAMIRGATAELDARQVAWSRQWVPGAFELPAALAFALKAMARGEGDAGYDGFIALGCVIEGETDHYEHICREASRGLMNLAVAHAIPFGFGLLTCRTYAQAEERVRIDGKNKGGDAARACLRMIELKRTLLHGQGASSPSAAPPLE